MSNVGIYVPKHTILRARKKGLNISRTCWEALEAAVSKEEQKGVAAAKQNHTEIPSNTEGDQV